MALNKNLISGSTTLLILRLLEDQDLYGYEMIELLRQRSKDVFELKAGTLYPLLHSLEVKGILASYESEANGKIRKYYQITKSGRRFLKDQKEEWRIYAQAVANVLNYGMQALTSRLIAAKVRR
ncbi:MAG: PadR family transcriptional regulator [Eubacterium sp.]|nr:PadR family transcriptional regulator [Eubacterium sp.]